MGVGNTFLFALLTVVLSVMCAVQAQAVSDEVRTACESDYMAYCGHHQIGSPSLRSCMRENRARLSPDCRHALVDSGEASPADVRRYKREMAKGSH